ncbi:CDP-glycerol glycerophosphotransferase family protein [Aeromicrobium duanguangcaii]|uniref:CDP-glycerol glycerophosphotransferase family protein n=1 Tax=Aeromicrobium duanguangcaii TaxID=2968086 RepID=A0ABY5KCK0_9ACTN|nr:CDP-glycerol glycerophosphotransferase family protein [Aeromicrobium duanguangcaii]MCD9155156.1 CDP-glycerol glycerophosphotransferase family protein [Aeromicrobium duanguangcaii]UUI68192.1 CDP-glycerol glycerophosphotransferase family protein [Aeromicrobium duanguangcaii]
MAKRVRTAFRLDEPGWRALVDEVAAAAHGWSREDWLNLPVRDRVALYSASIDHRDVVDLLAESRTVHGPSFLVERGTHRIRLGEPVDAPDWMFVAQEHDLVARVAVEVAGSSPVYVAGTSFISGITFDPTADSVSVEATTSRGTVVPEVTMRPDAVADAESGERWADQTEASWWVRLELDRSEPITLAITVTVDGVVRRTEITIPVLHDRVRPVGVLATDAGVRLTADGLDLRVAAPTQEWGSGTSPLSLDAVAERFGAVATIPSGRYAVTADVPLDLEDPEALCRSLADRAIDFVDLLVTARAWSPGEADVSLVVRNPIPVEDRGRRRQRLLLDEIREHAGPLRERALVMCFSGTGAGDSVAPIARGLVERGIPVDWVVTDHSVAVPEGMRPVLLHSREWHDAFTHARYLVNNAEFPHYVRFREGQRYLQTWHGTPLKRVGHDIENARLTAGYTAAMERESKAWEALLAQNAYAAGVLPRALASTGRTIVEGYPRNDALALDGDGALRHRTREALGLGDELVVLYAPTWRDSARDAGGRRAFVSHLDAARVHERTGATVLLRSHSNAAAGRGLLASPGVVDVTGHPDITALLAAADVLVTDYSSVMFDFAVTERLQILLVPDADEYRDERGFYLDLREMPPGPVVTSTDEVIEVLLNGDTSGADRTAFRQRFAPLDDGEATARVLDAWLGPVSGLQQAE